MDLKQRLAAIRMVIKNLKNIKTNKLRIIYLVYLILFSFICSNNSAAQGNLVVTPRRIVFDGTKRSLDLNLANIGQDTATYAISMVQIRMKEDGGFETITTPDPGQNFADKNIRFFPRSVTLPPKEAQMVKVQLLRTSQLAPGEYRSHFYFRAIPKIKPLGEENTKRDSSAISVQITPIFGITIPVIIRIGESNTKVSLADLAFQFSEDGVPLFSLKFNRTGNFSVFGDLAVDHVSPQGTVTRVGIANGIAVYTPNTSRQFGMKLNKVPGVDFTSGKLQVVYSTSSDVKPARLAEAELILK